MTKLSYKVSYYVFYVCIALILVVLALFFGVGYNQTNAAGLVEPANTPALIFLMYGLFAVTIIATLIGALIQFGTALRDNPKAAIKSFLGVILLVVLLVITYNVGASDAVVLGDGTSFSDVAMLKVTDMFLYSTYILFAVATIGVLLNLSGIFKNLK